MGLHQVTNKVFSSSLSRSLLPSTLSSRIRTNGFINIQQTKTTLQQIEFINAIKGLYIDTINDGDINALFANIAEGK